MSDRIPVAEPGRWFERHLSEIETAIRRVLTSGQYLLGKETIQFESNFAAFCQTPFCIATNSGTDALVVTLMGLDVKGGEVLVPGHTATATISAILQAGAKPVFLDIADNTVCINPDLVEENITSNTRALVAVHMFGMSSDMSALRAIADQHNIPLVEDCAQAMGAQHNLDPV